MSNPLLSEWHTPHQVPPFDEIEPKHFLPAYEQAFAEHDEEADAIAASPKTPDFANTIEALEASGATLKRIMPVFHTLVASNSSDEIRDLQKLISPKVTAHFSRLYTRQDLFQRIEAVYHGDLSELTGEQCQLVKETWKIFTRAGAALDDKARAEILKLDEELSRLQTAFGQNVLKDSNEFELVLDSEDDLAGLPESVRKMAAREAAGRGMKGKYVFTISRSSITPFLQYSERRDLRETMWRAYIHCADNHNEFDNNDTLSRIAALRAQRAQILGFSSHADYVLADRMAGTPEAVTNLLDQIWEPAKRKVRAEAKDLQDRIQQEGGNFELAPWDWWYYTEKVRADKYDLDAEDLKPYFPLDQVRDGAFEVAEKLYGIKFKPRDDIPVYHEDVQAYEVTDHDGSLIGLFLADYFMRPSKRSGAWMNPIRRHATLGGKQYPVIFNTCNFPQGDPPLLGMDEVRTLFHEFGHGLHGLLSRANYDSLSGTMVKRDFVELPSQIMEHWAVEPDVLKSFARHYDTGEVIPDELVDKILATRTFNQGFATTEYLAASYLDMKWHELQSDEPREPESFEKEAMRAIDLIDVIAPRYRSTYFQHIFSGGYSAGYYSYIWAEVLDEDAYEAFRENGIFDQETANSFRRNVLERGGTDEPMDLYVKFRGREPDVAPLLKGRGLAD